MFRCQSSDGWLKAFAKRTAASIQAGRAKRRYRCSFRRTVREYIGRTTRVKSCHDNQSIATRAAKWSGTDRNAYLPARGSAALCAAIQIRDITQAKPALIWYAWQTGVDSLHVQLIPVSLGYDMNRIIALSLVFVCHANLSLLADEKPHPLVPTFANVSYGPHAMNVLDFWQAAGDTPRPLLVYIHGGGWVGGDKKRSAQTIRPFLEKGISYASINYRLTGKAPLPAPVHDAARAIQFIRSQAKTWNINQTRIALTGGSAGACTSMWILLHDDLADPEAEDPVSRESTRVVAAAVAGGQTSIDPMVIEGWLGPNVLRHKMINMAVGEKTIEDALKNYEQHRAIYVEFSPYNHVDGGDPPLLMTYGNKMQLPSESAGHGIHHPVFGVRLKEKSDRCGHECHLLIKGVSSSEQYDGANVFLMDKLLN